MPHGYSCAPAPCLVGVQEDHVVHLLRQRDLASRMRLPSDWGLEIVSLFEALRHRAPVRVCQVEIAERYEHKHQSLSGDDPTRGLNRMARDVGTHLLRTLAAAGVVPCATGWRRLWRISPAAEADGERGGEGDAAEEDGEGDQDPCPCGGRE